jgi:diguanylate cyclase (GGDEF)-like protein
MSPELKAFDAFPPERFVVEVFSELRQETVQSRWQAVNVIVRLSMLSGLQMPLDASLNMLCDFAAEIAPHDSAVAYFWDEGQDQVQLRVARNLDEAPTDRLARGNVFNFWSAKFGRPLIVTQGRSAQADRFLEIANARSALIVPLFASNRVLGSLQLFSSRTDAFNTDDAQLLWIVSLVSESMLTRDYANDGLIQFAFTDYLTGLKTRGYFEQQLELEIKRAQRKSTIFSLLMIDIDHFKALNDHYGHHVGDQVLRDVASILMKDMREVDTVARYGGEEFVIILPETSGPGAVLVAERLRRGVEQARFFAGSPDAVERLSISIGISVYDDNGRFRKELIEAADSALYTAKSRGRNSVILYSDLVREQQATQREVS